MKSAGFLAAREPFVIGEEMLLKKTLLIAGCVLFGIVLPGCAGKNREDPILEGPVITFINEVVKADIWILPQTEEILKTTLWGTATSAGMEKEEKKQFSLDGLGGPGTYVVRIIDTRGGFYSADGIPLEPDYTIRFTSENSFADAVLEVLDENGRIIDSRHAFVGRL